MHTLASGKTRSSSQLMIVPLLTEFCPAWKNEHWLAEGEGRDDRTHAGMGNHKFRLMKAPIEFCGLQKGFPLKMYRVVSPRAWVGDLAENLSAWGRFAPFIDRTGEPIEG